jgi:catechol 2,3-dioxygenase-like lactoylglutathione lyase family enzyme
VFENSAPFSGFSVDDIDAARTFYSQTMEMTVGEDHGMLQLQIRPDLAVLVYPSELHSPGSYTVLNFPVDDIDAAVEELGRRGVSIERYDGAPQDDKGIVRGRANDMGPDIAWFKDPAGNVLSVLQSD